MRKRLIIFIFDLFFIFSSQAKIIELQTCYFKICFDEKGYLSSIFDKGKNKEYLFQGQNTPLLSIRCNGNVEFPTSLKQDGNNIILLFDDSKIEAKISVEEIADYITFEVSEIRPCEKVELIIWGPYPTIINEIVGECVGVVRNKDFAFGIQALNVKTLGGYPTNENDVEPAYDIFSSSNFVDVGDSIKFLYRGQTAKHTSFGSVLQAYTRNRNKTRIIPNWGHVYYEVPPFDDGGVVGSKIALFGCPSVNVLEIIEDIEINEGLPHPTLNGQWLKIDPVSTASYLIMDFNERNIDKAIQLTKKAGLEYLYHGDPFETWGHFKLKEKDFPDNWESMKRCVDQANKKGVKLGVHTLSNFITTNDPYVTPVPDPRLAKVGGSVLTKDIDTETDEIFIESPLFFNQMENNSLHAVLVDNEIIRYNKVSENEPWRLEGCVRGAFNTFAASHQKGDTIKKLMDHPYKVFLGNTELSLEIAKRIAEFFNKTGLRQISFDGLEGLWATGLGQYGRSLFTKTWYDNLSSELQGKVINDASNPSHFNWHINTRYNWGEPWYAGFRESQTNYRLMNQDFFRRNLLPSMLGWFSMTNKTSIEDVEWLLARAAGFDAGFAFNVSLETVEANGQSSEIFNAIKTWETARMCGAFSNEQKRRMQDIKNEFHLEEVDAGKWELFSYHIERFIHEQKIRQPGEPLYSSFDFYNPYETQPINFIISFSSEDKNDEISASKIIMEVNNYHKIEIPIEVNSKIPYLKLENDGVLQLFDNKWNLVKEIEIKEKMPYFLKGHNQLIIDAEFKGEGNPKLNIEIKTRGRAELCEPHSK